MALPKYNPRNSVYRDLALGAHGRIDTRECLHSDVTTARKEQLIINNIWVLVGK